MEIDTLRLAIAIASLSFVAALLIGWLNVKRESFLIHGAIGTIAIVIALLIMGFQGESFVPERKILPYVLILFGIASTYSCTRRFRNAKSSIITPLVLGAVASILTVTPMLFGLSALLFLGFNTFSGILLLLCAYESWQARQEANGQLMAITFLYALVGASYLFCSFFILLDWQWTITVMPDNIAEAFNAVLSLIGLTLIGALTLTLHYARASRHHKLMADTDALTGAFNRRALFERFPEDSKVPGTSVIMLDLDHFKQINDHFGHAHGDTVLRQFTNVLRDCLRPADLISRLGGEEFCVVVTGLDKSSAESIADRIRLAYAGLRIPINAAGQSSTVSAGLAIVGPGEAFSAALRRADAALYEAKRSGRNQVQIASLRLVA
ncbi:GGDEF domain-containing protein [Devosia sp. WQ 349]|uniref:GGDEF domain-containing protein n=1 Tax=Devosia sp. WQ 349K1 TaxID=2800329 RepID=UPI001906521E|nr:GGDEF domain-containing protein [Devosia sp. WQ 349K1]MBK1793861.1 GGDEF domain-containing protein [Devosia sp. WQ 349K1]